MRRMKAKNKIDAKNKIAFVNARILDPDSGTDTVDGNGGVLVENGAIADIGPGILGQGVPEDALVIDCHGACLSPGLVDMRASIGEPGFEHKETIESAGHAAISGGVTTLVSLPDADPVIDNVAGVEFIARRAREARLCKIHPMAAVTQDMRGEDLTEIGLLAEAGAVAFTDLPNTISNAKVMQRALSYASTYGHLIVQHPEQPELAEGGVMNSGEVATRLGLAGIPRAAEVMMIERDLRLVEMTGARYHVAHISTRESVEVIRSAKKRGLKITCDTAPPYFALTEIDIGDYRTFFKLSPPLRDEMDRRAIADGVADGTIDAICSDHRPEDQDSKRVPFAQAAFGAIGLGTLLPVSLELAHRNKLPLLDLIARMTTAPAQILGLKQAGRLAKGNPADLIVFDVNRPWRVDATTLQSKSWNSPFDGRPVSGMVLLTMVDGRILHTAHDFSPFSGVGA